MRIITTIQQQRQQQLETVTALLKQDMRDMFAGLSVTAIKDMIKSDETCMLHSLLEIAFEAEGYEICDAVWQVLSERMLNEAPLQ